MQNFVITDSLKSTLSWGLFELGRREAAYFKTVNNDLAIYIKQFEDK